MTFYLTLFLFFIFIITYFFNRDILFPANILTFSFFVFSFFTIILMKQLQTDIIFKTFFLIIMFVSTFAFSSNVTYLIKDRLLYNKNNSNNLLYTNKVTFINIPRFKIVLVLIIQIFALLSFIFSLKSMFGTINSETLRTFRAVTYYNYSSNYYIPDWISFFNNVSKYLSLFSIFILINNHFSNIKKYKNKFLLMLSSIIYILITLLGSSRYDLIIILFYTIFIYLFYLKYLHRIIFKSYIKILIIFIVVLLSFNTIGVFIGREDGGLVSYIGGSIALFNEYMKFPIHDVGFGINTFGGLYKGLYKLHLINQYNLISNQDFGSINGAQIGNVYTALRAYYSDFGIKGVFIFPLIYGGIFGFIYRKIKSIRINGLSISLIIYAYICGILILTPYSETLNNTFLSLGFFNNIFQLLVIRIFYLNFNKDVNL